jgi:hypothetical protein
MNFDDRAVRCFFFSNGALRLHLAGASWRRATTRTAGGFCLLPRPVVPDR